MKYYNKQLNIYYYGGSMTMRVENNKLFSGIPSAEQLYEWGFREWIEPAPKPEQLLEMAKASKIAELMAYDGSEAVNGVDVVVDNITTSIWFDKSVRADYKASIEAAELLGEETVTPIINNTPIKISIAVAKVILAQIQIYANACYSVTENHKTNINSLSTIEDVEHYDFTKGYPNKLHFTV